MIFQHTWRAVLNGIKTQTTRVGLKRVPEVGQWIAIQPGRGEKAVGNVMVLAVYSTNHARDQVADCWKAEGFISTEEAVEVWQSMHGDYNGEAIVIRFQLVETKKHINRSTT